MTRKQALCMEAKIKLELIYMYQVTFVYRKKSTLIKDENLLILH